MDAGDCQPAKQMSAVAFDIPANVHGGVIDASNPPPPFYAFFYQDKRNHNS
jgi:hypothetical protein